MYCPSCGKENPDGAKFCRGCGTPLAAPVQPVIIPDPDPVTVVASSIPDVPAFEFAPGISEVSENEPEIIPEEPAPVPEPAEEPEPVFTPEFAAPEPAEEPSSAFSEPVPPAVPVIPESEYAPAGPVCPVCGAVLEPGAKFCNKCGAALASEPAPATPPISNYIPTITPEKPKKKKKTGLIIGICAAAVLVALALVLIFTLGGSGGSYDARKGNYYLTKNSDGDELLIYAENGDKFSLDSEGYYDSQMSLDAAAYAIEVHDKDYNYELFYFNGSKPVSVSDEAEEWMLSADGTALAYTVETDDDEYDLFLYKGGKSERIAKEISYLTGISADGKYIGYVSDYDWEDDTFKGYYYANGKTEELGKNKAAVAFSANGKYVYYGAIDSSSWDTTLYVQKGSDSNSRVKLGKEPEEVIFNSDCTEVLIILDDGKTYYSKNGGDAVKLSSSELYPVIPSDIQIYMNDDWADIYVCGISSFKGSYLQDFSDKVYYFKAADDLERIASKVDTCYLASDMKTLFYLKDNGDLCRIDGTRKNPEAETLAEDVYDLIITLDGKTLFYVTEDDELFALKGKGKAICVNDDYSDWLSGVLGDTLYFACDDELCRSKGGKSETISEIPDDVYDVYGGYTYILVECEDDITYLSFDGKTFTELD